MRRLIVLIPGIETDHTRVIRRVWDLAHALGCDVLFLSLCREAWEEPGLRRALVTMSSLVQDGWVAAGVQAEIGHDWLKAVQSTWREGDLIVCFSDHCAGLMQKPLSQILESKMKATVYVLAGTAGPHRRRSGWLSTVLLWTGFVAILFGFFLLQLNLESALKGWVNTITFAFTVLVEFWLVWVWNNLFS